KIGQVVKHKYYSFRGIVFDVDPIYSNTEEYLLSIPKDIRPKKNQPFYHLLAQNNETEYVAYVSEQNLEPDLSGDPLSHPQIDEIFSGYENGEYILISDLMH
ncbi:MAG: heat shock protein HspQ, partial [Rhodobiaceae bacterium]|nr:heat shock protein HspQ [Rhodobiaceae bacterium]